MFNENIKFSLWCDFLERDFIHSEFKDLLENNIINGATSNPSIFKSAILNSNAYTQSKKEFSNLKGKELYEMLAIQDIRSAAKIMLRNFTNKDDGFVSLEVDPNFSNNASETIKEGIRLYNTIAMPNVMIKIPATNAGYEAMSELISKGINVNATLIFSPEQTMECLNAFKKGIKEFKQNLPMKNIPKAVISIFVSRFDRLLDEKLEKSNIEKYKVGILNATKCYHIIQNEKLDFVKALFASTGVKGKDVEPAYYIKELMFENSVNTAPLGTIKEFIKEKTTPKIPTKIDEIELFFDNIKKSGIDMDEVYKELLEDGIKQFVESFRSIIDNLK